MNIKKERYKKPKDIEANLIRVVDNTPIQDYKGLVDKKFFTGDLEPIIENYLPEGLNLTTEELVSLKNGIRRLSTGIRSAIPITCYGEKCPFSTNCPLAKMNKYPLGKICPIEEVLMDTYTKRYLDEFNVSSDSLSEVTTMTMLAATHIMEMRALITLGKDDENSNPNGFIKNVVGFNTEDEPIVQLQEHPAYNIIEKAWRWRKNLLESLVGTRKEKYKQAALMGDIVNISPSTAAADLKAKIDKMSILDISDSEE